MSKPLTDGIPFAKLVAIFAASFAVGLGLCGLGFFLNTHGVGRGNEEFGGVQPLGLFSLIIVLISFLGLVVTLLTWAVTGILRSLGFLRGKNEPQKLFEDSNEERPDKRDDA